MGAGGVRREVELRHFPSGVDANGNKFSGNALHLTMREGDKEITMIHDRSQIEATMAAFRNLLNRFP